jgi:type IV pilus assembly protein PilZ
VSTPAERRAHHRIPIALPIEYPDAESFVRDYTVNISRGGLFVRSDRPPPIGTRFDLRLHLPGLEEPYRLTGEVMWRGDSEGTTGFGLRFLVETVEERRELERIVERVLFETFAGV